MANLIGQYLGRYHILEQLGEGGMATVYKAFDTRLEANVAVKVIRTDSLAPNVFGRALKRFEREAKALARLTHANIVKVSDYGEYEGHPFLVMPYLPGGNLKERLKKGGIPWPEAVRILIPIARALAYAHKQGIIHRDVKPSNILITESGDPMLTDFGVAKVIEDEATVDLTGTAMAVGTPEYMAPEQATSKSIDHRVDIYALGIVFYEMVTGRKPYMADTPLAVLFKQASEPLPRPKQYIPNLPDKVEQIILKALAKKPEDRYQTMGEFATALERCLTEAAADQRLIKSSQAAVKPIRGGMTPVRTGKAQTQEETPPIATRPPEAAISGELPTPHAETAGGWKNSGKRTILISGVVVLAAVLCLGAVLLSVLAANSGNKLAAFSPPTVTFTPLATATLASTAPPIYTTTLLPTPLIPRGPTIITPNNAFQVKLLTRLGNDIVSMNSVAFSPEGTNLASGSDDKTVKLWRVSDGALLRTMEGHTGAVWSVAFSPDGTTLASGSMDSTVKLWRVSDGALLRTLKRHTALVTSVVFSPDGTILASGSGDSTVRLWRVSDGALIRTLEGHPSAVYGLAFSPDGTTLASGSYDKTIKLWRVSDGALIYTLEGHTGGVNSLAFSPDGNTLASGSDDKTVKLWQVPNGALLHTLEGHSDWVLSVAFSPDGTTLASGSGDKTVKLWRVSDGALMRTLEGHTRWVNNVAFSPDGTTLASGDGTIRLWGIPVKE